MSIRAWADLNTDRKRAVLSQEPVRTCVASGENATATTKPVCPARVGSPAWILRFARAH